MAAVERQPKVLEQSMDWGAFKNILKERGLPEEGLPRIRHAFYLARGVHSGKKRENGEPVFNHPLQTALILINECKLTDSTLVVSALLHDVCEASDVFGDRKGVSYVDWSAEAEKYMLEDGFEQEDADILLTLTEPTVNRIDVHTREQTRGMLYEQVEAGSPKAVIIKMADRLHNLRTQYASKLGKQIRKIKETEDIYFPLFEKAREVYPVETEYLMNEMKKEIEKLKQAHRTN